MNFIFQPAEENEGGGRAMVEDGLFGRFPCDAVYGMHNWPGLPAGEFAINHGPMMAALDIGQIVLGLQTIPSRMLSAMDSAIVSITQIHGGDAWNVIPDSVVIRGTVRCFDPNVQDRVEKALKTMCISLAVANGATATVDYMRRYPPTVNSAAEVTHAIAAAKEAAGAAGIRVGVAPSMASEDFAFMLQVKPGAYIWLGADGKKPSAALHNPHYDFNDETLEIGASYWVMLVHRLLGHGRPLQP